MTITGEETRVEIVAYDPAWRDAFEREAERLRDALGDRGSTIEHVGSTAVPGLAAKSVVDVCLLVSDAEAARTGSDRLQTIGYERHAVREAEGWIVLERVDGTGQRFTTHVGTDPTDDARYLRFRDFLRDHPDAREAYERVKRAAAEARPHDVSAYTDEKSDFVASILEQAREAGYDYDL